MRSTRLLWLIVPCLPLCLAAGPATRPALPDAATQRRATAQVQEVFKNDLTNARSAHDKAFLANKMIESADQTEDDPAGRYALLAQAADLAASAGDVTLALKAAGRIEAGWSVDGLALKADLMKKAAPLPRRPEDRLDFARSAEQVGDQAVTEDRYAVAKELNGLAVTALGPGRSAALTKHLSARAAWLDELAAAYASLGPSLAKLQTSPADPAANLAVGKFEAFTKGDWRPGLAKIALGNDPALQQLVIRDHAAASSSGGEDRVALADAWWTLAEQQQGLAKQNLRLHAAGWYQAAGTGLTGLAKLKAERRIAEVTAGGATPPDVLAKEPAIADKPGDSRLQNHTDAKEAGDVIVSIKRQFPEVLEDVKQIDLVRYHNASDFKRNGGKLEPVAGSYCQSAAVGGGRGILLWGIYEKWDAGKYVIVYRVQELHPIEKGDACFLDVCSKGVTFGGTKPSPDAVKPGEWTLIPVAIELGEEKELEYRLWPFDHLIALDRVYIFRLR